MAEHQMGNISFGQGAVIGAFVTSGGRVEKATVNVSGKDPPTGSVDKVGDALESLSMEDKDKGSTESSSAVQIDPSELADLLGELQGLKDWRRLALKLRFSFDAIRKIKADNKDVVEDCILEVMDTWLKKGPSSSKPALIRALEGVQEYAIAAKIRGDPPPKPSEPLTSLPDGPLNSSQHLVVIVRELQELLEWQKLGLELGLSYATLEGIAISNNKELDGCKRAMMESWLQGKDNVQNQGGITKKSLVDALERAEFITLAHKLDPARAQSSEQS